MDELDQRLDAQLDESFAMYGELIGSLAGEDLARKLPVPSNIIGAQLWCVVGARESWARAIEKGAWDGFACSITGSDAVDADVMRKALAASATAVRAATAAAPRDAQRTDLKLRLLVHESQHQGQILRYLLGLKLAIPPMWRERFALGAEE
jgi:hypothetical protein